MTIPVWNPATYRASDPKVELMGAGTVSPPSLAGLRRTLTGPGGYWMAGFSVPAITDRARVLAWRAFVAAVDHGAGQFEVRLADKLYAPWPLVSGVADMTPGGIVVALNGAAAIEATTIAVTKTSGDALTAGQHFSLTGSRWGKRLHRIRAATDNGGGSWTLEIRPGLREALATATALDFETPGFIATVANAREIEPQLDLLKYGSARVEFMEDFTR